MCERHRIPVEIGIPYQFEEPEIEIRLQQKAACQETEKPSDST